MLLTTKGKGNQPKVLESSIAGSQRQRIKKSVWLEQTRLKVHFGLRLLFHQCIEQCVTRVTSALRHGAVVGLTVKASTSPCVHFTEGIKKKEEIKKRGMGMNQTTAKVLPGMRNQASVDCFARRMGLMQGLLTVTLCASM